MEDTANRAVTQSSLIEECAKIIAMDDVECTKKLGDTLFSDRSVVEKILDCLDCEGDPSQTLIDVFILNPCISLSCNKVCLPDFTHSEWYIVLLPFAERGNVYLNLHEELPVTAKQCIQVLMKRNVFTITEKKIYGNECTFHSFQRDGILSMCMDSAREAIARVYLQFLKKIYVGEDERLIQILTDSIRLLRMRGISEGVSALSLMMAEVGE